MRAEDREGRPRGGETTGSSRTERVCCPDLGGAFLLPPREAASARLCWVSLLSTRRSVGHAAAALCLEPGSLFSGQRHPYGGNPEPAPGNCLQVSLPCTGVTAALMPLPCVPSRIPCGALEAYWCHLQGFSFSQAQFGPSQPQFSSSPGDPNVQPNRKRNMGLTLRPSLMPVVPSFGTTGPSGVTVAPSWNSAQWGGSRGVRGCGLAQNNWKKGVVWKAPLFSPPCQPHRSPVENYWPLGGNTNM